jgi:translation elongation factor aEF-1 beta
MGRVAITLKVYPESPEVQDKVRDEIKEKLKPAQVIEIPVFGGLNAYKVIFVRDDKQGEGTLEEDVKKIAGVSEVQTEDVSLIS